MPKRPARGGVGERAAKRPRQRRLYLVTEDWKEGYSIYEVDLTDDHGATDADFDSDEQEPRRLPSPVLRLEAPHNGPWHFAAAFGTKIMALHLTPWRYTPVFDVQTRCLTFGPPTEITTIPIHVPVGDSLFKLGFRKFHVLRPAPPRSEVLWCKVPEEWSWHCLTPPPFGDHRVTSHAVHPDGRTLFVTVKVKGRDIGHTFTCDTGVDTDDPEWTAHREWELPFKGHGHYDHRLDAWVGLTDDPATVGHICCCRVPSLDDARWPAPAWKLSREKLFCRDPTEMHTGASLVYLGTGHKSRFCLVECLSRGSRHQLRLTTFSPRYHKNGDLGISKRRWVRSFKLPKTRGKDSGFLKNPVAFWL
ncbi:uncharacterized protein LOC123452250 [Hordeum vulgare subsp. vulgare]|uniref:DUF1618 domain-containing protein n=1 Tax=Hordeum vulgare subsp. vulgare TaxID=112509 RepID=M0XER0_HORVV|nr:uncharacterized protein LOC123452250 [Hordeum vulgare subsp. vulgare]XP_044984812.1 uncharacterized protein LOC123452250 [Hordeum vulgare subsp. vulgare]XP_044984813.1 uncharacterized protein LOC123452250 [Hordeum vulgare subsp. vulgare]KAI4984888.1 hypothetical protein ZWY2020_017518 [Hordeum vulgare]